MALLSDRAGFDRLATKRGLFCIEAGKYIRRVRNKDKKTYAELYYKFLVGQLAYDHSGGPDDPCHGFRLSYMAQQAVRLELDKMYDSIRP